VLSVGVLLLAVVWALPFLLGPASTRGIGLFPDRSGLGGLLLVHGAFLLVATLYLLDRAPFGDRDDLLQVLVLAVGAVALSAVLNVPAVGLFVPPIVGAWVLLRRDVDVGFELVLLVAGLGLALLVEFVYVIENAGPGRFNTVFKLYAQVWAFLAIASGGMVAVLFSSAGSSDAPGILGIDRDVAVRGVVAVLVFSTSLYGAMALPAHFAGDSMYDQYQTVDDPTLDATAFLKTGHPEEAEAIRWLDRTVEGQPNIVTTAPAGYYWRPAEGDGAAAAASLTGIPTVAGWNHAADFQGHEAYDRRVADVNAIYTGDPAEKAELLARYDVEYVYVGPAERANHGRIDYEGVDCVGDPEEFGEVLLYPVDCG
jgi:YYY domain-containing protein